MSVDEIYNAIRVNEHLLTAGQPTADQFRAASADGFDRVINLAPFEPEYSLPDEAELVRSLHMTYIHIPVVWSDPKLSDFEAFEQAMGQLSDAKTLVHCAANYRVSAFYSLYAQKHLGWTREQADMFRAKIWGSSQNPVWNEFIARVKSTFEE